MEQELLGLKTSQWTAIGTILVFLVTVVYASLTWILARAALRSAGAAEEAALASQRAADASERGVVLAAMPVLVVDGGWEEERPFVTVANVGDQPALNVEVQAPDGDKPQFFIVLPGDSVRASLKAQRDANDGLRYPQALAVEYQDKFGTWYRTERRLDSIHMGAVYSEAFLIHRREAGAWILQTPDLY